MADNSITFDINLNDKKAQNDLVKLQNKINDLKKKLADAENQKPILEQNLARASEEFEKASQKLEQMKAAGKDAFSAEEIKAQANDVSVLGKRYDAAFAALDKNNALLAKGAEDLQTMEDAAAGLVKQLNASNSASAKFAKGLSGAKKRVDSIGKRINGLIRRVLLFSVIARGLNAFKDWMADTIKTSPEATEAIGRLKGALLTLVQPLVNVIIPAFTKFVNTLAALVMRIAELLSRIFGFSLSNAQAQAKALDNQKKAISGVGKAAKKASKQLASFDELNILSDPDSASGGGGGGAIEPIFDTDIDTSKYENLLKIIRLIGEALLAWKISDALGLGFKGFIGALLVIDGLVNGVKALFDIFQNGASWENITKLALALLEVGAGIALIVGGWLPLLIAGIAAVLLVIMQFGGTAQQFFDGIKEIFGGLVQFIKGVFTGDMQAAFDGLKTMFKGVINVILAAVGGFVNSIIKGLNWLIGKINTIRFTVPSWVPGVGGKSVGFNIPMVGEWNVPKLATGSVVPPNREFMAMLGDNKKETEVVSPLSTMKQAFKEALAESGGNNKPVNIYLDGKVIASTTTKYQNQYARARG